MYTITIDVEKCQACEDCVTSCPIELFEMTELNGRKIATLTGNAEDCIGCMACESICEEGAITVLEA